VALKRKLFREGPVGLDTVVFIYFMEDRTEYMPLLEPLFGRMARGEALGVTSDVTLIEVLVVPYRVGDVELAERYESLLTRSRGVHSVPLNRGQLKAAARIRAVHGLKTPDALQIAAALSMGCASFVTNDREIPPIPGLEIVQLRDLLRRS
jgi:predicted nucleic acid-binding protein